MSATVAIEHKKPTRRLSMSGLFGGSHRKMHHKSSNKVARKVAGERRKSFDFEEIIMEEAEVFSYNVATATSTVDHTHIIKDKKVVTVESKVPIPKEDIARNALNREIRSKHTHKLVGKKRSDAPHRGLFDSFRSARKPTKYRYRSKETKNEKRTQYSTKAADSSNAGTPLISDTTNMHQSKSFDSISEAAKANRVFVRLHSADSSPRPQMHRQTSSNSQTSEDSSDSVPVRKVQDLSTIKVVGGRRPPKCASAKSDKSWLSDDDGISSGSNTPISLMVTGCSTSDSDSNILCESKNASTAPATPLDDLDDPFMSPLIQGSVTLPRRPKKKTDKLKKQHSKSQESLLTTIVNAVAKMNLKDGDGAGHLLEGASHFVAGMEVEQREPRRERVEDSGHVAHEFQGGTDVVSALTIPSTHKKGRDKQGSDFTTWDGREASTLPRHRRRRIGIGHIDNIADGREKDALRDLPWLTVKNKTKKGNNANSQRPQSMMISKLPTTYGGSLPGNGPYFPSDVGRVHGLPVRQSIARPVTTYETGKNSDSMGDGRSMKSYKDEDSNSLHSGSRTPPHISQFNAISGSVESLDEALDLTELESDADLMIKEEEPEAWSLTVDEKMLKKMDKKDVKRQENIYEFIQKERNFLTTLKIMQKIFARGMSMELQVDSDVIDRMFPQIDEFVDFTSVLVCNLDERQKRGQAVEQIGDVLVEHWSGDNGCRMLWLFSEFCKKQNDIVAGYKDMIKNDKKLLDFTKRCNKNPMTRRRDIPGCILLVTQRITKYPVILKTLIDNSNKKKHKTDCTNLNKALEIVTEIIKKVDKQVLEYEKQQKVKEICQKMESKSYATYKDGRKFLKDDLMLTSRKILQIGSLQWKVNNMKRPTDITLLLFNDVLALLQENNQRFVFPSVGQPAVVPLHKLIVREKAGEDNVLFLISASSSQPEMYELVCQKPSDSKGWMQSIRSAVDECPEEDEGVSHEDVEEQRIMEQKWERAHQLIVDLEKRDRKINELLQEKMEKFKVLVKVVEQPEAMANMKFRYPTYILDDENAKASKLPPGAPILQKAMEQVNKLSHAICGPGGLSRNPSSVGEHESGALPPTSLPKRSETFGGFDNGKEPPSPRSKWAVSLPKLGSKDGVGSSSDESKRDSGLIEGEISNTGDSSANSSPMATVGRAGQGVLVPPTSDQISALAQITHLMNEYMSIATQQDTHIEKMQLKMAHARDKLSYSRRRNGSNLQEAEARRNQAKQSEFEQLLSKREDQLKTEREQWERQYKRFQTSMEKENQELKDKLEKVKRDEIEVQRQQEDVKRAKDEYQRQMARLRELQRKATHTDSTMLHSNSYPSSLSANRNNSNNMVADDDVSYTEEDRVGASLGVPAALSKSHSSLEGELSSGDTGTNSPTYATSGDYPRTFPGVGRREPTNAFQAPQHHHSVQPPAQGTAQQPANLPIHLKYSATNQVTGNMGPLHSDIPSKLLSSSKATNRTSQAIPGKLAKLATSSHQSSQSSAKPTFTDGLKNKLPHFHKKAPRATNSSSELIDSIGKRSNTLSVPNSLKQSKSEANIDAANNRNRSVSSPNPSSSLSPPDNDSALERSNSASSSSSREGSEKGRKKKGKRSSWGSNSDKQPKEEIYL